MSYMFGYKENIVKIGKHCGSEKKKRKKKGTEKKSFDYEWK